MSELLWQPDSKRVSQANLTAFRRHIFEEYGVSVADTPELYEWSIASPEQFWPAIWSFCGIVASRPWQQVLDNGAQMPGARWFTGTRLNFAENLLRFRDSRPAIVFWNETGRQQTLSYAELFHKVASLAAGLRSAGVGVGDRVAGYLPNLPETVVSMLATTSLGAIWSSTSPDFGLQGVLDRFGQIQPKILIAAESCVYQGQTHDCLGRVSELVRQIPSVERTLIVPRQASPPNLDTIPNAMLFDDFLAAFDSTSLTFEQLPFDHPVYILYSSGTTGVPKCIVHGGGGTLIQHLKELVLHTDLKPAERIFYYTTCGWMMWNWLVSSLAVGATVVLYDGSPFATGPETLFELAEREQVQVFGTSARYLAAVEKAGYFPAEHHNLSALRSVLSTGSPLAGSSYDFVYQHLKPDVCLSSISGGTDIVSCFALGDPTGPVYRGELQTRGLGMRVEVYNDAGQSVRGEQGELVCTAAFPSMPVGFWNDPDQARYRAAYFERFPNVWCHGDWAELTSHNGLIITGRSDAVLNPGGVRIGTGEIYRQVEQIPEVLESLAVAQDWQGDVRIVLFVRLADGMVLDDSLLQRIRTAIRENATPRHVPRKIIAVADLPRTVSGKLSELAVRNVIHGRAVKNREALANPDSLALFQNLPELQT